MTNKMFLKSKTNGKLKLSIFNFRLSILTAVFAIAMFTFSSCGDDEEKAKTLASIVVTAPPAKKVYIVDEPFNPAGMVVSATFSDGSTTPVTVTANMLTYDFTTAGENKTVTVSYAYEENTETATVSGITVKAADLPFAGVGSSDEPFQINTTEQFLEFAAFVNSLDPADGVEVFFKQTADIHLGMSPSSLKSGISRKAELDASIFPIGTKTSPFRGTWYGDGWKITGLYVEATDSLSSGGGLFGHIDGGTVLDLHIEGTVIGILNVGGVTGSIYNGGSIINCSANVEVHGETMLGGIAGQVGSGSRIVNCYAAGTVTGTSSGGNIGGIAGWVDSNGSSIANCYAINTVSGTGGGNIGGIVGHISGYDVGAGVKASVTNCYATGAVSGLNNVGGVAGSAFAGSIVSNCVALNQSVMRAGGDSSTAFGRVVGYTSENPTLTNNAAYSGMMVLGNVVTSGTLTNINGADMTANAIKADGTIGNRFTAADGWITAAGKLPGFGAATAMPGHIQ